MKLDFISFVCPLQFQGARARTVLSEKQLNILKTCYSANPRPDALMKEQLVEMTTLSPRVIRVWFQNKRCKDKKIQQRMQEKQMQRECVSLIHIAYKNRQFQKVLSLSMYLEKIEFSFTRYSFLRYKISLHRKLYSYVRKPFSASPCHIFLCNITIQYLSVVCTFPRPMIFQFNPGHLSTRCGLKGRHMHL